MAKSLCEDLRSRLIAAVEGVTSRWAKLPNAGMCAPALASIPATASKADGPSEDAPAS